MKKSTAVIAGIVGFVVLVFAIMLLAGVFQVGGSQIQGAADKASNSGREKSVLFDPNNSIGTYQHFYDLCQDVVKLNPQVKRADEFANDRERHYNAKNDPFGHERAAIDSLHDDVRALENQQDNIAGQYNADSAKTTQAQFKGADLPYQINPPYDHVSCGDPKEAGR